MSVHMTINQVVRESISLALIQLMGQKPLEQISVSEICQLAGVSRSSFYRNYDDKNQVLHSYIHNLYRESFHTNQLISDQNAVDPRAFLLPRFRFIRQHGALFTALCENNLIYTLFNQMDPDMLRLLCGHGAHISEYHLAMSAGACAGVIRHWIANDFHESPEELVDLFLSIPIK